MSHWIVLCEGKLTTCTAFQEGADWLGKFSRPFEAECFETKHIQ